MPPPARGYSRDNLRASFRIQISAGRHCTGNPAAAALVVVKEQLLTNLALTYFAQFNLDYVDCILLARNKLYGREVATFDKELEQKLATVPSVSLY